MHWLRSAMPRVRTWPGSPVAAASLDTPGDVVHDNADARIEVGRKPLGVAGFIIPWIGVECGLYGLEEYLSLQTVTIMKG